MLQQMLIDVIVCFVGIDRVHKVSGTLTILLYVIQYPYSRVAHGHVDIARDRELMEHLPSLVSLGICHHVAPIIGFAYRQRPAMPPDAIPANTAGLPIHPPEENSLTWGVCI